ncbi:MAG: ABC transporter ATP-binding protein [Phycisphaerae bacterium]|mgnify:CR=1 FL=1|nr:MAG: ABC transporter ATP-binding protein [Phycisphaerae bacterium]
MGDSQVPVLKGVNLIVRRGEFLAIEGRSGSGKSTLLHLLAGLDTPQQGAILVQGEDLADLARRAERAVGGEQPGWLKRVIRACRLIFPFLGDAVGEKLARIRNRHFGFIFQFYHLLPELNVLENTMIASWMCTDGPGLADRKDRARSLLEQVGLSHRLNHRPSQLSGGERQRVAIARALVNDPDVLFADEPTGNLDSETGAQIMGVLESLHARGQTIVMVTHDRSIARRADRSMVMKDGRLQQV